MRGSSGAVDAGLAAALEAIRLEADAVAALGARLGASFLAVLDAVATAPGRLVVTGLGKSGLVGRKIAATLASTGTPSVFVHAADALHGDSGMVARGDILLALSASGETEEVCAFAQMVAERGVMVVALTGDCHSTLASLGAYCLDVSVSREADPLNLAPTASTAAQLAMGDALAAALMIRKGFTAGDFAAFHPGGSLGKQLLKGRTGER
jgi:arabinose-5-phosphate isomerase